MSNLIRPSLVVFDLDGTLYDYDEANAIASSTLLREFSQSAGVSKDAISDAMSRARMNVKNRLGSTAASHSRLLYISEAYRLLKLHPDTGQLIALEEIFWKTFLDNIKLFGNVEALLSILKKDCIPLALITDLTSNIQYKKATTLSLNLYSKIGQIEINIAIL
jgi:putative hydrolase of the HAD superfamily